jgi:tight adherence protein C
MKSPISPADAQLCGKTPEDIARSSLLMSVIAFCLSLVVVWIARESGIDVSSWISAVVVITASTASYIHPITQIRKKASTLRRDMNAALAAYLDLVNVLLAGGAGMETALLSASEAGDGWCFDEFRMALARARSSRVSFWDELRSLGERYDVDALIDVAHSVQLAGEHGARVRMSLQTKAASLRARNLATIEYEAQQSTEHMGVPMVMLFLGFIILIGYPAFASTLGVL